LDVKHVRVKLFNGRKLIEQGEVPNIREHCFAFCTAPSEVGNFEDPQEVMHKYFPEVEALIRRTVPGADHPEAKVLVFDHALRTGGANFKEASKAKPEAGWGPYGALVHSDNNLRSVHTRAKDWLLGTSEVAVRYGAFPARWGNIRPSQEWRERLFRAEAQDHASPEGRGGEHMIVNVWRPLAPVENWGLAVLDGRTLVQDDVHPSVLQQMSPSGFGAALQGSEDPVLDLDGNIMPVRMNELHTPLHDPAHRWIYFPDMRPDEALVFKICDSRRDGGGPRGGAHTAVKDPRGKAGAQRSSIEVRTLVILPAAPQATTPSKL
jgi:hypothetical protein